jgi:hypothetical protein
MVSGHVISMIKHHRNIAIYSNQAWERQHSWLKALIFTCTQRRCNQGMDNNRWNATYFESAGKLITLVNLISIDNDLNGNYDPNNSWLDMLVYEILDTRENSFTESYPDVMDEDEANEVSAM